MLRPCHILKPGESYQPNRTKNNETAYWTIKQLAENRRPIKSPTDGATMSRTSSWRPRRACREPARGGAEGRLGAAPVLYRKYHHVFNVFFCGKTSFRSFRVRWFSFLYWLVLFVVSIVKLRSSFVMWMTSSATLQWSRLRWGSWEYVGL